MTHYNTIIITQIIIPELINLGVPHIIKAANNCESIVSAFHENIKLKDYNQNTDYIKPWPYYDYYNYGGRWHGFFQEIMGKHTPVINEYDPYYKWTMIAANVTIVRDIIQYTQSNKFTPNIIILPNYKSWPNNQQKYKLDMKTKIKDGYFTKMLSPYMNNIAFIQDWHY